MVDVSWLSPLTSVIRMAFDGIIFNRNDLIPRNKDFIARTTKGFHPNKDANISTTSNTLPHNKNWCVQCARHDTHVHPCTTLAKV